MTIGAALGIMGRDVGTAFDPDCFDALRCAVGRFHPSANAA